MVDVGLVSKHASDKNAATSNLKKQSCLLDFHVFENEALHENEAFHV